MTTRFVLIALFACGGCKDRPVSTNQSARAAQNVAVDNNSDAMPMPVHASGQPHKIRTSALTPWMSIAESPVVDEGFTMGDRINVTHDVFHVGGFRLTFVSANDPSDPESIGRIEYVFRDRSVQDVSKRLVEALRRFEFTVPPQLDEVIARASRIPDDLDGLDMGERLVTQVFDWAPGWRGFVKLYAEGPIEGKDTHRAQWMVELRAFQPAFRAASDP